MAFSFPRYEDNLILELCGRRGTGPALAALEDGRPTDWDYISTVSEAHNVSAEVFARAIELPLSVETKNKMGGAKAAIATAICEHAVRRSELSTILSVLSSRGIECMLLKGLSLDRSMLRRSGDIDILIKPHRLVEAINSILDIPGYIYGEPLSEWDGSAWSYYRVLTGRVRARIRRLAAWKHEFHLYNPERGTVIELHVNIFFRNRRNFDRVENLDKLLDNIDRIWKAGQRDHELGCVIPSPEHSLLLMCLHSAIKRSPTNSRFRLSTIVDINALVSSGIDWDTFISECLLMGVAPFVLFSLQLARRLLNAPVPARVLPLLKDKCTGLQLMLVRFHLRCVSMLQPSSFIHRELYYALGPFAYGGTFVARLWGALLMPMWLPSPRRVNASKNVGGGSLHMLLVFLLNPFRGTFIAMRNILAKSKRRFYNPNARTRER